MDLKMRKRKLDQAGLSLVELVITMIISGVLFVTIAMIIIYANQSWIKAARVTEALRGSRIAKKTMEYQIRSAITMPATFFASTTEPFMVTSSSEPFEIANDGQSIKFNVIDRSKGSVYKLDRFRRDDSNNIMYDYWYAYTDSFNNTTYTHWPSSSVLLLQDVQKFSVTRLDFNPTTNVKIDIIQATNPSGQAGGQVILSTTSFNIKTRNLK
jgi:hypothetical protein